MGAIPNHLSLDKIKLRALANKSLGHERNISIQTPSVGILAGVTHHLVTFLNLSFENEDVSVQGSLARWSVALGSVSLSCLGGTSSEFELKCDDYNSIFTH